MMELVHPDLWQPGMIHHGDAQFVSLLAVRNLYNMELVPACMLWPRPPKPFVLPKQYLLHSLSDTVRFVKEQATAGADWEGVVLQGDGEMCNQLVKIKSPSYIQRLSLVRGLSPQRIVDAYVESDWDGIRQIMSGLEELLLAIEPIRCCLDLLRQEESQVLKEIEPYQMVPLERIQEVPVEWRWVVGYRNRPDKMRMAVRKCTARRVLQKLEESQA